MAPQQNTRALTTERAMQFITTIWEILGDMEYLNAK